MATPSIREKQAGRSRFQAGKIPAKRPFFEKNTTKRSADSHFFRVQPLLQRKRIWEEVEDRRELKPGNIPRTFNYEFQQHRLIAHTVDDGNLDQLVELINTLHLFVKQIANTSILKTVFAKKRERKNAGDRVSIDITPFLPNTLQTYLKNLEGFYEAYRAHMDKKSQEANGVDGRKYRSPDEVFDYYGEQVKLAKTRQERDDLLEKQTEVVKDWYRGMPSQTDEYTAACHNFLMLTIGGTEQAVTPGQYNQDSSKALNMDLDPVRTSFATSIAGNGPYRIVPNRDVRIGDLAVFKSSKSIPMLPDGIIHSAPVIRVSENDIELMEKTNPHQPVATRTVAQILKKYSSEKARVYFLSPALKGMPGKKQKNLGASPPTQPFQEQKGVKGKEDSHVLFEFDAQVSRAHEDMNIFSFLAKHANPKTVKVHGYASKDGDEAYNFNLSAHRAVVVQQALKMHLPKDTKTQAIAHGEIGDFGPPPQNRRAGIEVEKNASAKGNGSGLLPGLDLGGALRLRLDYGSLPDSGRLKWMWFPETSFRLEDPDYVGLIKPFISRGLVVSEREFDQILQNRMSAIRFYRNVFGLDLKLSATLADFSTSFAYDTQLSIEYPNKFELDERNGLLPEATTFSVDLLEIIRFLKK